MSNERRAPVQGAGLWRLPIRRWTLQTKRPGSITWEEHLEVFRAYSKRYGGEQDAERIIDRGGFGYWEAADLLGHQLRTWKPESE